MSCLSYYNPKQKTHFPFIFFQEMPRDGLLESSGLPTRGGNRPTAPQTCQNLSAQAYQEIVENHKEILFYACILEEMEMPDYSQCGQGCGILRDKKPSHQSSRCGGQKKSLGVLRSTNIYGAHTACQALLSVLRPQQSTTDQTPGFRGADILVEKGG